MPIVACKTDDGKDGFKWGESGKSFLTRGEALAQGRAIQSKEKDFKEFAVATDSKIGDWIEAARVGKFPQGNLTTKLFDELVKTFDAEQHEPPHTLGHIREDHNNKPAHGWVEAIRRVGDTLLIKSKQISQELDQFVRDGMFKKRSIGIRVLDSGKKYFHHIAWLGSMTPAVRGLANVYADDARFVYSDRGADKQNEFEFEFLKGSKDKPKKRKNTMELSEQELKERIDHATEKGKAEGEKTAGADFETQLADKTKEATEKGKADAEKDYNEKLEKAKKQGSFRGDCDALIKEFAEGEKPRLVPAQVAPLRALLFSLDSNEEVEYTEIDKEKKEVTVKSNTLKLVRDIITNFAEVSTDRLPETKEGEKGDDANYELEKKKANEIIEEFSKRGKNVTYGQALIEARSRMKAELAG